MKPPDRLSGTNPLVGWLNRLRDAVMANEVTSVSNGRMEAGRGGTQIICGGGKGWGGQAIRLRFKSSDTDYIIGRSWDGTTEGSTDVYVAKPYALRESTVPSGYSVEFTGTHPNRTRTKTLGAATEDQVVTPAWYVDDEIWAMPVPDSSVSVTVGEATIKCPYILAFDSRAWARKTGT